MKHIFSAHELLEIEKAIATLTDEGKQQFFTGNEGDLTFICNDSTDYYILRDALRNGAHKNKSLRRNCGIERT